MKLSKAITFTIIFLLLINISYGATITTSLTTAQKTKLTSYTDSNFKQIINYKTITFTNYKTDGRTVVIYTNIDGKQVKWITNIKNYNNIIR